jgi:predicted ATPase
MHIKKIKIYKESFPVPDKYPFNLPVLQNTAEIKLSSFATVFVGENGTGKSTILSAAARKCGIYLWEENIGKKRRDANQYEDYLHLCLDIEWIGPRVPGHFFGAQSFNHFTRLLDEWEYDNPGQIEYFGGKSLTAQSHGQSLLSFFKSRYALEGVYFLDEPETALSPGSQMKLIKMLKTFEKDAKAQFIIATHSPILMSLPGALVYSFDGKAVKKTDYRKTKHFKTYRDFFSSGI